MRDIARHRPVATGDPAGNDAAVSASTCVANRMAGLSWTAGAVVLAGIVALPAVTVLSSLAVPRGEVWTHLWQTQLVELTGNTLLLFAGVGVGTGLVGTLLAWLVTACRFPGRKIGRAHV